MYKKSFIYLMICIFSAVMVSAAENNCLTCHSDFEDADGPSHLISKDIHIQKGLGCVDCHGGDASLDDMDDVRDSKTYRGVPSYKDVPKFCARCHSDAAYMHDHNPSLPTDQFDKYKTSVHGKQLLKKGDTNVANCISCHTVHQINTAKLPHSSTHPLNITKTCGKCHSNDKLMKKYGLDSTPVADYKQSVHGYALFEKGDLSAPVCNDCHGNHGAAPPGVASLIAVCGNCHAIESELFNNSPHKVAFEENDFPMCMTCHSNHKILKPEDKWIGTKEPALCVECHSVDDGTKGIATAGGISNALKALVRSQKEAQALLDDAKEKEMSTTDVEFTMNEVQQSLIHTRTKLHSFNLDSVLPSAEQGMKQAEEVKKNSASLIDEFYFRRKGLGVASLIFTLLVIGLYLFIRKVEKK